MNQPRDNGHSCDAVPSNARMKKPDATVQGVTIAPSSKTAKECTQDVKDSFATARVIRTWNRIANKEIGKQKRLAVEILLLTMGGVMTPRLAFKIAASEEMIKCGKVFNGNNLSPDAVKQLNEWVNKNGG